MERRFGLYARVSTRDQEAALESQLMDLRNYCKSRGFTVYKEYVDIGVSGVKESRPALNSLWEDIRKAKLTDVIVFRFDRFARSLRSLTNALVEMRERNVAFHSFSENIDTTTASGEFFFSIFGALAQMERAIIIERVKSGLRRAVANGKHLGRPAVQCNVADVMRMRAEGCSLRKIADFLGVSKSKVAQMLDVHKTNLPAVTMESGFSTVKAE